MGNSYLRDRENIFLFSIVQAIARNLNQSQLTTTSNQFFRSKKKIYVLRFF